MCIKLDNKLFDFIDARCNREVHLNSKLYYQQLHLKYLCNLARYWLQAPWGWHDSVETCRSVIICEIIVNLLVIVQNDNKKHHYYLSCVSITRPWFTNSTMQIAKQDRIMWTGNLIGAHAGETCPAFAQFGVEAGFHLSSYMNSPNLNISLQKPPLLSKVSL